MNFANLMREVGDCRYIETYLLYHGAATVQRKKPANLINFHSQGRAIKDIWSQCTEKIEKEFGLEIEILRETSSGYLVLLYNKELLARRFSCKGSKEILERLNYPSNTEDVDGLIGYLKKRFQEDPMPHEVGLFLGYPCRDVCQFIKKKGECSKGGALWKVYGNLRKAQSKLRRYQKAQEIMGRMLFQGKNLSECAQYFRTHSMVKMG